MQPQGSAWAHTCAGAEQRGAALGGELEAVPGYAASFPCPPRSFPSLPQLQCECSFSKPGGGRGRAGGEGGGREKQEQCGRNFQLPLWVHMCSGELGAGRKKW